MLQYTGQAGYEIDGAVWDPSYVSDVRLIAMARRRRIRRVSDRQLGAYTKDGGKIVEHCIASTIITAVDY